MCVSDSAGILKFMDNQDVVPNVNHEGNIIINADTIDKLCADSSFIKLDVEGFEMNALKGASKTIAMNKPRVVIAAYHRREDCFALQLELKKYRSDYKFYFRWHRNVPDDVMLYAV